MPPRASIRVRVLVMQKRADYSSFLKHGQIEFVRTICPCYFFLWFWSQNQAFSALFPIAFLLVTLCFSPRNSMTFGCYLYELVFLRDDV